MTAKYTPQEFAQKVDWEGGIEEAILGYGLNETDLDRDDDPELHDAVKAFREAATIPLQRLEKALEQYFDEF